MQKAKKYDWKDSNLALFGSDTEKKVKKESAESEKAWQGSGKKPEVKIWRINKFKVDNVQSEDVGKFYSGDSYIILNTYKEEEELKMDVHFWIGKYSTQDEYGTAAYKTVELDTFHDDKPIQHREVQGHESKLFKTYFETMTILKGGNATGFRRVAPESYEQRLFQVIGERRKIQVKQIPAKRGNITSGDVFILDQGLTVYQFNGSTANKDEKFRATQYVNQLRSERGGKPKLQIIEEREVSQNHPFYQALAPGESKAKEEPSPPGDKILFKVSDEDGSLDMEEVARGDDVSKDKLTSEDVYIVDTGSHCYVWIGSRASIDERKNAMTYAHNYLSKSDHPYLPVTVVAEGKENAEFKRDV